MDIEDLLQKERGNFWLKEPGFLSLYARVGMRLVFDDLARTIDLANFVVKEKGKGVFTRFVSKLERYQLPIFVESVINPRFAKFLPTLDFVRVENVFPPSFIKVSHIVETS